MFPNTLKIKPDPDFNRFEKVLRRQGIPDRVPFYEIFSNIETEVLRIINKSGESPSRDSDNLDFELREHVKYMYNLGYDYVSMKAAHFNFLFPQKEQPTAMTTEGERSYQTASHATIINRKDFEEYSWPEMSSIDYSPLEFITRIIPEGMKVVTLGPGGVLENVMWLLGYEGISYLLYDDESLVSNMFDAVGSRIVAFFDTVASFDFVGAMALGDDMGFKTQIFLPPELYRKYVFPWHRKIVEVTHGHGKPVLLHTCGNLEEVMEDIIDCGWDAKHSFEDSIQPVWEAKEKYGDRIAVLGGFDMDKLCRMKEEEVRAHTRFLIEKCAHGGGWALGTGNSVANYIPARNFLAMLEEGFLEGKM